MRKVIVIGAGASGMAAAIAAAGRGASVTVLEGNEKPGKKLLLTGSGRCNLSNLKQGDDCYRGADPLFAKRVLERFTPQDAIRFFRSIGLLTCDRDGYVYPVTGQASSVLDVLLLELSRRKVKMKYREKVRSVSKEGAEFLVKTDGWTYRADAVVLAAGSMAVPSTGSDGSGYDIARMCGHRIVPPMPALVPLTVREQAFSRQLSGLRMRAAISLHCTDRGAQAAVIRRESGELQWTDYGISGIAVFQLSRYAVQCLEQGGRVSAKIDLLPDHSEEELLEHLRLRSLAGTAAQMLVGILPAKAVHPLLQAAGISPQTAAASLAKADLDSLAARIKRLALSITGSRSFDQAQSCQGGVDCSFVDPETMESRLVPGLYFSGEILDVDGACGGYNLQWAWASGHAAGSAAGAGGQERTD